MCLFATAASVRVCLFTCEQMLMHVIVRGGCTNTVRESALKVDSGRKISLIASSGNGTRVRTAPEFLAQRSTHQAIAPLRFRLCGFYCH